VSGEESHRLKARQLGIDTHSEMVVFMRRDSPVCRSEGLTSHNRIALTAGTTSVIATLYQMDTSFLALDEAGLSESTWQRLGLKPGDWIGVHHAPLVESLALVRGRIFGHPIQEAGLYEIIADIVAGRYSAIEISSFVTECASAPLSQAEISGLTRAMVNVGDRLSWNRPIVADKHSVGGLPGNRTTPIIVAIAASLGLIMPKTSSRAITSPAGTADTMETLAPVDLDAAAMRKVVEQEGGCVVWGGAVGLSPADDILIRIERALDIDSEGQMIASVLSKKIAAGATHLVLDMPVGPTAKVRTPQAAATLAQGLMTTAQAFGIKASIVTGDGSQPIGRGMGPALEARDVLAVLKGERDAPVDLRARALSLAGALLELVGKARQGTGVQLAAQVLDDGRAWTKFQRICEAQGGMRTPPHSRYRKTLTATKEGVLTAIDNRRLARLAKLAGAPLDKAAGIELHVQLGDRLELGGLLCTLHAEAPGELAYALNYASANPAIFELAEP
jgi:thymidine phosphorylase